MRSPWKRRRPSEPNSGCEGLLNRITAANVTETQERKQTAGWRMVGGRDERKERKCERGIVGSGGIPAEG